MLLSWLMLPSVWPVPSAWFMLARGSSNLYPGQKELQVKGKGQPPRETQKKAELGLTHDFCCVMGLLNFPWSPSSGLLSTYDKVSQSVISYPALYHGLSKCSLVWDSLLVWEPFLTWPSFSVHEGKESLLLWLKQVPILLLFTEHPWGLQLVRVPGNLLCIPVHVTVRAYVPDVTFV